MSISYDVTLDVRRSGVQDTVSGFYVGDTGEKMITAALTKGDMLYRIPEGSTAYLYTEKPDGTHGMYPCSISNNRIYITPQGQMLTVPGIVRCQMQLLGQNGNVLYCPEFAVEVAQSGQGSSGVESSDEYTALDALLLEAGTAIQSAHTHENKSVLDTVTAVVVSNSHTHSNQSVLDTVTAGVVSDSHTHANKAVLDIVTAGVVSDSHTHANQSVLDTVTAGVVSDSHTHANKAVLDTVTAGVVSDSHTHANKSVLDTVTAGVVSDSHTHANKSVLDTVTADVVSDSHAHSNKSVLDTVTADVVSDSHTHSNKSALDTFSLVDGYLYSGQKNLTNLIEVSNVSDLPQGAPLGAFALVNGRSLYRQVNGQLLNGFELFYDRVKQHTHDNKTVLDKFGEADGQPTYDGNLIGGGQPDTLVPLSLGTTYPSLSVRSDWQDVPVYNTGANEAVAALSDANGDNYLSLMYLVDEVTGMPCPVLQVSVGGVFYNCYGTTYHDIGMVTRLAGWYTLDQMEYIGTAPTMENISFASLIVYNEGTPTQTEYNTLDDLPADAQCALETLSRIFNVSVDAMGGLGTKPDGVQRLTPAPQAGRRYAFATGDDITFPLPQITWTGEERDFWVDLDCTSSINLTFSDDVSYEDGGNVDTTRGKHRLHFYAPAGAGMWTVAETESYTEITEDFLPEYVIPFQYCTADQIRAVLKLGYSDGDGNWCVRRKGGVVQTWFSIGDTHPVTLTDGREVTMRIIGIEHDDMPNGSKATLTCDFVEAVGIPASDVSIGNYKISPYRTDITNIYELLPEWLKQNVVKAKKVLDSDQVQDYMWAFSVTEIGKTYNDVVEGSAYPYYTDAASRKHRNENGDVMNGFLRTMGNYNRLTYLSVTDGIGYPGSAGAKYTYAVLGFCLYAD